MQHKADGCAMALVKVNRFRGSRTKNHANGQSWTIIGCARWEGAVE